MQDEYAVSYVEGFFFEPTKCEPLFHAWVESGGMAIDPTCPEDDGEEYIPALHIEPSVVSSLRCELGLPLSSLSEKWLRRCRQALKKACDHADRKTGRKISILPRAREAFSEYEDEAILSCWLSLRNEECA
jgi:hypothetical protein